MPQELSPDMLCHRSGFKKTCGKLRDKCPLWQNLVTTDVHGAPEDNWSCADVHTNRLLLTLGNKVHELSAETSALRKDVRDNVPTIQLPAWPDIRDQTLELGHRETPALPGAKQ